MILSFFNLRGKYLLDGLKTLLDDTKENPNGLVNKLYTHGQIFGLFKGNFDENKTGNLPAYIPSQNFALAFLGVVASLETDKAVDGPLYVTALRENAHGLMGQKKYEKVLKPLVSMIDAVPEDLANRREALRKSVEDWYNRAMGRVSGAYKYRTQWYLLGIGLVLAVALNADTVTIVKQLSIDSALRQSIVAAVQTAKPSDNTAGQRIHDQIQQIDTDVSQIENIGIPLGWAGARQPSSAPGSRPGLWGWLQRCVGWLLTAVAISLGAPFWFDLLNKIAVVRSTVKPSEKTQGKESKDQ